MNPAIASPAPPNVNSAEPLVGVLRHEWPCLSGARPNILLVGDRMATDAALGYLQVTFHSSVIVRNCGGFPLVMPPTESVNTLILRDAAALLLGDQQTLVDWLSGENRRTQVVTTSADALFPLVESGAFLPALYYRLNVIYIDVHAAVAATS